MPRRRGETVKIVSCRNIDPKKERSGQNREPPMRHRSIKAVYDYWNQVRGNRAAPTRTEIDPRGIAAELGDVFLLDGPTTDFRFRLAGSRIIASVGQALTGRRFSEIWLESAQNSARLALMSPAREGEPILIGIRAFEASPHSAPPPAQPADAARHLLRRWPNLRIAGSMPKPERRGQLIGAGEMILLPLTHQNRPGDRIFGALALFEPLAVPATGPQPLDISGTRILSRASQPNQGTGLLPGEIAETIIGRRGHLVVMRGTGPARERAKEETHPEV
jgi:hypothetical protein